MPKVTPEDRTHCLHRDGYKCCICGRPLDGCPTGYSIHHRHMRSHKWPNINSPSNLICVCGSGTTGCHGRIHQHPADAYTNGWLIHAWDESPETVPMTTYRGTVLLDNNWHKQFVEMMNHD